MKIATSTSDSIDPALREPLEKLLAAIPGGFNAIPDMDARRTAVAQMVAAIQMPDNARVTTEDRMVRTAQAHSLRVRVYRPLDRPGPLPGVFFIHGGGMVLGDIEGGEAVATKLCDEVGALVVSVDYRLAPEHPYPAAVEDCYAGFLWTVEHAQELGFDDGRLAIYGGSAGGGLVLAVTLLARDRGGPRVRLQMPIYPMIDDLNDTPSSHEIADVGVWDRAANVEAWRWYLGGSNPDAYAAPARADNLTGLPPTFIDVGTVDLFRDEDITFAARLMRAGVPTELHVYPGVYHGAENIVADAPIAKEIWRRRVAALQDALLVRR